MTNKKPSITRMKGETAKSYALRCTYLELPPKERSLDKTVEKYYNVKKGEKNYEKFLSQIGNLSSRWSWKQCAEIYDAEKRLEQLKLKAEHTEEVNESILDIIDIEIKTIKDMLDQVNNDDTYTLKTKAEIKQTLIRNLKNLNEMFRLCSGLSTTNNDINLNAIMDVDVEVDLPKESVFEIIDKELGLNDGE